MALGPRPKTELELHWRHQQDHVRSDLRNIYRRLQNDVESAAFAAIAARYQATGELVDLRTEPGTLESMVARAAQAQLPEGA